MIEVSEFQANIVFQMASLSKQFNGTNQGVVTDPEGSYRFYAADPEDDCPAKGEIIGGGGRFKGVDRLVPADLFVL